MMRRCSGFTLIELLIAITLAAGVTLATTLLARAALEFESRHSERWALQADQRSSRQLLEHYWPQRQPEKFQFDAQRLLLYLNEGGTYHFIGFACEEMETGPGRFVLYRWPATHEASTRVEEGEAWPLEARQTLLSGLAECRFSFMQPPPVHDREASPLWVMRWEGRNKPEMLRFEASSHSGWVFPPVIIGATAP